DGDLAAQNDEHARAGLAGRHQTLARAVGPRFTEALQPLNLGGLQRGKHLLVACLDHRTRGCSHAGFLYDTGDVINTGFDRRAAASVPRAALQLTPSTLSESIRPPLSVRVSVRVARWRQEPYSCQHARRLRFAGEESSLIARITKSLVFGN